MGDERCQERHLLARERTRYLAGDLVRALLTHLLAAGGAALLAYARIEDAQVVVDLRHRADRRARIAGCALLFDRDGRRKAAQMLDARALELPEELPRIRAQCFHVPALPLGVERIEGEARF